VLTGLIVGHEYKIITGEVPLSATAKIGTFG